MMRQKKHLCVSGVFLNREFGTETSLGAMGGAVRFYAIYSRPPQVDYVPPERHPGKLGGAEFGQRVATPAPAGGAGYQLRRPRSVAYVPRPRCVAAGCAVCASGVLGGPKPLGERRIDLSRQFSCSRQEAPAASSHARGLRRRPPTVPRDGNPTREGRPYRDGEEGFIAPLPVRPPESTGGAD